MKLIIINGPNLNLLGVREPEIYGRERFDDYLATLRAEFPQVDLRYFQSNAEGAIIDKLHEVGFSYQGVILNAGAYTHTSLAIADAVKAISAPVLEVHISNVYAREPVRRCSLLAPNCVGGIYGLGLNGYALALRYFLGL
jgi:3-dehydroquinate dehydratase-2